MKKLNLKSMIETYQNASDADEAQTIWHAFYNMYALGFISWDVWSKFYDKCHALEF